MGKDVGRYAVDMPEHLARRISEGLSANMPGRVSEYLPDRIRMLDLLPEDLPEDMPDSLPEKMSVLPGGKPEDMPVRMSLQAPYRRPN